MNIKISAQVQSAVRGMKKVGKEAKKTGKDMTDLAVTAVAVAAAYKALDIALSLTMGTMKKAGSELAVLGDRMAKQAKMVGVTAEQYQVFEFAAKRSGTSIKAVSNGLKKLGRVMLDARNGSRQIKETFEALDIELMKSDGTLRDVNDVFLDLADRFAEMGPSAERTGSMMLLLGRSGTEMANMMASGAEGITEMRGVLEELGALMGDQLLADSESFVDMQADLEHASRGVAIRIGESLIPALTDAGKRLTEFISKLDVQRMADFAEASLASAEGVLLLVDAMLGLDTAESQGMGVTEGALRKQSRALEDLIKRLESGRATASDFALTYSGQLSGAVVDAEKKLLDLAAANAKTNDTNINAERIALASAASQSALNKELIEGARNYMAMGVSGDDLSRTLFTQHGVTADQIAQLRLLFDAEKNLISTESELAAIYKERTKTKEDLFDETGRLRSALSGLGASRENEKKGIKGVNTETQSLISVFREYQRLFGRDDTRRLDRLFENDLISQQQYLDRYMASVRESAQEEFEERKRTAEATLQMLKQFKLSEEELSAATSQRDKDISLAQIQMEEDVAMARNTVLNNLEQKRQEAYEKQAQLEREQFENQLTTAGNLTASIGSMFSALSQIAMQAYESGDEEAKKHAIALFHVSQAFALATATVNTALAVSQALATPPPTNIPMAVAAGIAGAAEIATIVGTSIAGIGDAGLTSDMMKRAGLNNHSAIVMRNDETLLDPVGTKHITEMLAIQKAQMQNGGGAQTIRTTVELDGRVLGESVDNYLIRQQERGLAYGNRVRQEYV